MPTVKIQKPDKAMTESEIIDEINRIAALQPDEMTVEHAQRSSSLRNSLLVIKAARAPISIEPAGN